MTWKIICFIFEKSVVCFKKKKPKKIGLPNHVHMFPYGFTWVIYVLDQMEPTETNFVRPPVEFLDRKIMSGPDDSVPRKKLQSGIDFSVPFHFSIYNFTFIFVCSNHH